MVLGLCAEHCDAPVLSKARVGETPAGRRCLPCALAASLPEIPTFLYW
ncbi:hypothetical protein [Moorena sp. SIO4G3]|nr:hypothetical protein [Moorena sp. SIO4G3]